MTPDKITIPPNDQYNQNLVSQVHPPDWQNPTPQDRYNLVVIGAGTAGLVAAAGAAGLGAKVALVEKHLMGGDCLNTGCVPSKALIRAGRAAYDARTADRYGIKTGDIEVDFPAIMERVRRVRAEISPHDSAQRFRDLGVDIFLGEGTFVADGEIEVAGATLHYRRAVIATGARAIVPPIEGLDEVTYYTNHTIFNLTELPERLLVLGGGPIGCELAQSFQRLGSQVDIIEMADQFLIREDRQAADILLHQLESEGIGLHLNTTVAKVEPLDGGRAKVHLKTLHGEETIDVDAILVGAGRRANVESLGLDAVGVETDKSGVVVNDYLQTTNSSIYASGDVCLDEKFTHSADFASRMVLENALFGRRRKYSDLLIPRCTYTDPEIAHVGLYEKEAKEQSRKIDTYIKKFEDVDRAKTEGETEGFVKILTAARSDEILGATIVGRGAGDMISEITLAMSQGVGLKQIASVIHPYPTTAEAIRHLGDTYNRTRLTPMLKKVLHWLLKFKR